MWHKNIIAFLGQPATLFHILLLTQLIFFLYFIFRPFTLTPPGHVYTTIDINNNFFYVNVIRQSKDGAWNIIDSNTTLFTPRIYAYLFFVILGKLALIFNLSPVLLYLLSRVMCGILMFYGSYWLIKTLLPKSVRSLALLFVLVIESGPLLTGLPYLFTNIDARIMLFRHFGLPHHLFAQATGMIYIGLLFLLIQKLSPKRMVGMIIFGVISTISMPAYLFTFALCAFPVWGVWALLAKQIKKVLVPLFVGTLAIVVPNLIFAIEFTKGLPWTNSTPNEKTWYTLSFLRTEYISTLLLYVPFIVLLLLIFPFLWRKLDSLRKQVVLIMLGWTIGPLLWIHMANYSWFPMPHHRLTDGYGFLPAGILAAFVVHFFITLIPNKIGKSIVAVVLISLMVVPSLYLTRVLTEQLFTKQDKNVTDYHIYPSQELWQGIMFLDTLPKLTGVLMREQLGEIILGFANVRIYVGGIHNFPEFVQWSWWSYKFFGGDESNEEASAFLKNNDISYVFFGPDEKARGHIGPLYPDLLEPIFTNKEVTIYKVKK